MREAKGGSHEPGVGRGGYNIGMIFQYNFGKTTFASDSAFEEMRGARVPIK
jgi:hypothetical protein